MSNVIDLFTRKTIEIIDKNSESDEIKGRFETLLQRYRGKGILKETDNLPKHPYDIINGVLKLPVYLGNVHEWDKSKHLSIPCPIAFDYSQLEDFIKDNIDKIKTIELPDSAFQYLDRKHGCTLSLLFALFQFNSVKIKITTKSDLIAHDTYITALSRLKDNLSIYIEVPKNNNELVERRYNVGAPSIKRRESAYNKLKSLGFKIKRKRYKYNKIKLDKLGLTG